MRIAIWTHVMWAFGRVFKGVQKYSKHDIDLFNWRKGYSPSVFDKYDLIVTPEWSSCLQFEHHFPTVKKPFATTVQGKAELVNFDLKTLDQKKISKEQVDNLIIPPEAVRYINKLGIIGCISHELEQIIHQQCTAETIHIPDGVDHKLFCGEVTPHDQLTVLVPVSRDRMNVSMHGYDVKRWWMAVELEKRLPQIRFLFCPRLLELDEMADFYRQGDVILCTSHSEGGPLPMLEAGAMGVISVTTNVGHVPELITPREDGEVVTASDDKGILDEMERFLIGLDADRSRLTQMRENFRRKILAERTWEKVTPKWDTLFEESAKRGKPHFAKMTGKFRFHLVGLAHLPCSKAYLSCAFTQKNHKLARMLMGLGHEVIYYGAEGSDVPCTRFVQTHTLANIRQDYGDGNTNFEIGYDWTRQDFKHDFNAPRKPSTLQFYDRCIKAIQADKRPDDFLLLSQGKYHKSIADAVGLYLTCEPGVGYRGSYARWRAFESSYIQNFTYGSEHPFECIDGDFYHRVIPNYFDPDDVEYQDKKAGYYLYIGRMIKRKGILTADLVCRHLGAKLIIAGQGAKVNEQGCLVPINNPDFKLALGTWEYVGFVNVEQRKKLMAGAIATFVPTEYLECFAGTHIESMLSGTPVITTDFGVFPATFPEGICGFHCDTLNDFVWAAREARNLKPRVIRAWAERYLMEHVQWQYQKWFEDLYQVWLSTDGTQKGWHYINDKQPLWRKKLAIPDQIYLDALKA